MKVGEYPSYKNSDRFDYLTYSTRLEHYRLTDAQFQGL